MSLYEDSCHSYFRSDSMSQCQVEEDDCKTVTDSDFSAFFSSPIPDNSTNCNSGENAAVENKVQEQNIADYQEEDEEKLFDDDEAETQSINDEENIFDKEQPEEEESKDKKVSTSYRKMEDDSIRKKFKTHFEESVRFLVNSKLKRKLKNNSIIFQKLPQTYLNNVKIDVNKKTLDMDLWSRYNDDFVSITGKPLDPPSLKKFNKNQQILKKLKYEINYKFDDNDLLKTKVIDLLRIYLNSKMYKNLLKKVEIQSGSEYKKRFEKVIEGDSNTNGYIDYFLFSKGNKKKKYN